MFGSAQRGVLDQLIYLTCLYDSALPVRYNFRLGCGYRQYDSSTQGTEVVDEHRVVENPNPIDLVLDTCTWTCSVLNLRLSASL
jgi:hypothetical protein